MIAGINLGNALLAGCDADGQPRGIAVDLARELGRHLRQEVELVTYQSAARMADAARTGAWDVALLAADPDRAADIAFTEPYLEIDATYLVGDASPLRDASDVDRTGIRIAVSEKSAYDLALRRTIRHAQIVPALTVDASVQRFFAERLDALAGLKPLLMSIVEERPGYRVLGGRFTAVLQAIGTPKGHDLAPLDAFVRHAKASGLITRLIERHGVRGVTAAPPGPRS